MGEENSSAILIRDTNPVTEMPILTGSGSLRRGHEVAAEDENIPCFDEQGLGATIASRWRTAQSG